MNSTNSGNACLFASLLMWAHVEFCMLTFPSLHILHWVLRSRCSHDVTFQHRTMLSCLRSVSHCFSHPAACGRHVWSLSRRFSDVDSTLLNYISSCELHPINSSLPKVSLGVHEIACTANKTLVDLTITSREQQEPKYTQWRRRVKEKFAWCLYAMFQSVFIQRHLI